MCSSTPMANKGKPVWRGSKRKVQLQEWESTVSFQWSWRKLVTHQLHSSLPLLSANWHWRWMHRSATTGHDEDFFFFAKSLSMLVQLKVTLSPSTILCMYESVVFVWGFFFFLQNYFLNFSVFWWLMGTGSSRGWHFPHLRDKKQSRAGRISLHGHFSKRATRKFSSP